MGIVGGTIEMFNRGMTKDFGMHGALRIDLQSKYEKRDESKFGINNYYAIVLIEILFEHYLVIYLLKIWQPIKVTRAPVKVII